MHRVIIGVGLAVICTVFAVLVAVIGHERVRYEHPDISASLAAIALAVLYLLINWSLGHSARRPRRRDK